MKIVERTSEPLLASDRPWEGFSLGYASVLRDRAGWHMWYGAYDPDYEYDCDSYLCYARSTDGVRWEKPSLGLIPYHGSRDNNIVHDGPADRANITTVFHDPSAPSSDRYKGLAQRFLGRDSTGTGIWHCYGALSPDGLRWRLTEGPIYPHNSDTQNVCITEAGGYRQYMRLWRFVDENGVEHVGPEAAKKGARVIGLSESPTFESFPVARTILAPDSDDPPGMDFYTSGCTKLSDDRYVMLFSCLFADDRVRVHGAISRDGVSFSRVGREPIMDVGSGFDNQGVYVLPGAFPAERANSWWFYYLGTGVRHGDTRPDRISRNGGYGRLLLEL